jgi:hypothetical protein
MTGIIAALFASTSLSSTPTTYSIDPYLNYTVLILSGDGANASNNNVFRDSSNNNFAITTTGNPTPGTLNPYGVEWSSYFVDGPNDWLSLTAQTALSFGTGDFTLEAWIYPTVLKLYYGAIIEARASASAQNWVLGLRPVSGVYKLEFYASAQYTGTITVPLDQWTHVVACRSSGTLRLFVNGVLDSSWTLAGTINAAGGTQYIGVIHDGTNHDFQGYISNLRVVKGTALYTSSFTPPTGPLTAITNTSLLACHANRFIDGSTNNFTLTRNGDVRVEKFSPFQPNFLYGLGWSNFFDGTGDYLTVPDNAAFQFGTSDYTIEAWIYLTSTVGAAYDGCLIVGNNAHGVTTNWLLQFQVSTNKIQFYAEYASGGGTNIVSVKTMGFSRWNHVAVSRSGGTVRLFLNGVLEVSAADSSSYKDINYPLAIGADGNGGSRFGGYISNVRIVKGSGLYTANFVPQTSPLVPVPNTSILTCQSDTFKDNGPNNFTISRFGDVTISNFAPFVTLNGGSMYKESTDALSTSTNLTVSGDFTAEMWVYPTSYPNDCYLLNTAAISSGSATSIMMIYNGTLVSGLGGGYQGNGLGSIRLFEWSHLVVARNSGTVRLYINGTLTHSFEYSTSFTANLAIGDNFYVRYVGWISDVRFVNGRAVYTTNFTSPTLPLTSINGTSLLVNFGSSGIYDSTGRNTFRTIGNAQVSTSQSKFGNSSILLDGTGDYLVLKKTAPFPEYEFGTGDFTIELWWYPLVNGFQEACFVCIGNHTQTTGIAFFTDNARGILLYSAGYITSGYGGTPTVNQWNHIAVTRQSGTLRTFLNGSLFQTATFTNNLSPGTTGVFVGSLDTGAYDANGYIDDLRITKGIARYTASFTPPTTPFVTTDKINSFENSYITNNLILYLDAGDARSYPGTGTVWTDLSGNGNHFNVLAAAYNSSGPGYMDFNGSYGIATNSADLNLSDANGVTLVVATRIKNSTADWRTLIRSYVADHQVIIAQGGWDIGMYDNDAGQFLGTGYLQTSLPNYNKTNWILMYWRFKNNSPFYELSFNDSPQIIRGSLTNAGSRFTRGFGYLGGISGSQFWGDISVFMAYNRYLTNQELIQNYNYFNKRSGFNFAGVVTDGLTVYLDAGNATSYPGSGATWFDISGSNNHMTLTGSPTYTSANGGVLQFNTGGTFTQYGTLNLNYSTQNFTIMAGSRYSAASNRRRVISSNGGNWLFGHWSDGSEEYYAEGWIFQGTPNDTNWRIYAGVENYTADQRSFYVNDVNRALNSTGGAAGFQNITVGYGFGSEWSTCEVSFILVYNRLLTTQEMTTNFNFFRNRFGI